MAKKAKASTSSAFLTGLRAFWQDLQTNKSLHAVFGKRMRHVPNHDIQIRPAEGLPNAVFLLAQSSISGALPGVLGQKSGESRVHLPIKSQSTRTCVHAKGQILGLGLTLFCLLNDN